jgi:hypothetical protein
MIKSEMLGVGLILQKHLIWLRASETEILEAYNKAMELLPDEPRFRESYEAQRPKKDE